MWTKSGYGENDYLPLQDGKKSGYEVKFGGLTKLEYFAGLNMQGMMANTHLTESGYIGMAQVAVKQAKVLLDELAKENF